jgi:hypothetical protein
MTLVSGWQVVGRGTELCCMSEGFEKWLNWESRCGDEAFKWRSFNYFKHVRMTSV